MEHFIYFCFSHVLFCFARGKMKRMCNLAFIPVKSVKIRWVLFVHFGCAELRHFVPYQTSCCSKSCSVWRGPTKAILAAPFEANAPSSSVTSVTSGTFTACDPTSISRASRRLRPPRVITVGTFYSRATHFITSEALPVGVVCSNKPPKSDVGGGFLSASPPK